MAYLLDTHALIWWWEEDPRLGESAARLMNRRAEPIFVSAVSGLEIAIKVRLGKLPNMAKAISEYPSNVGNDGFSHLAIEPAHARAGGLLPGPHRDPFDRVLAAQALLGGLTMLSRDPCFAAFGCAVLW
ncbi:type II toxin-antitoxin system VapC family toxin [Sphingomonas bacterium]|uniref:type II toxin-antitoxin system VapC family toxin n=1 Tax=Sphingomonas bacterium TaxID=1895847 RepID=UPI0015764BB9|nr:type II toxin-antitoxin system VapC family toxin [Sphingomonas bacterium]